MSFLRYLGWVLLYCPGIWLRRKQIAYAYSGENVVGTSGIGLYLVPQAVDVYLEHVTFTYVL